MFWTVAIVAAFYTFVLVVTVNTARSLYKSGNKMLGILILLVVVALVLVALGWALGLIPLLR